MSTSFWKAESFETQSAASPGAVTRGLRGALDRLLREIRRRRTLAALSALNDNTLKDIGLDRGMLPGVADRLSRKPAREGRPAWAGRQSRPGEGGAKPASRLVAIVFEARKRAAARDLRRFEACMGPNQIKEFRQRIDALPD